MDVVPSVIVHREDSGSDGKDSATDVVVAADVTEGDVTKAKCKAVAGKKATMHIVSKREGRAKMKKLYHDLRSLLPNVHKKVRLSLHTHTHTHTRGHVDHGVDCLFFLLDRALFMQTLTRLSLIVAQ